MASILSRPQSVNRAGVEVCSRVTHANHARVYQTGGNLQMQIIHHERMCVRYQTYRKYLQKWSMI